MAAMTETPTIYGFQGPNRFLSNFWPETPGVVTVEHLFQAAKTNDPVQKLAILRAETPGQAKRMGRGVTLRADWETVKDDIMAEFLRMKFEDPELRRQLLATGDSLLYEANDWNDRYWGVDSATGIGQNRLGHLLMSLRERIRNGN